MTFLYKKQIFFYLLVLACTIIEISAPPHTFNETTSHVAPVVKVIPNTKKAEIAIAADSQNSKPSQDNSASQKNIPTKTTGPKSEQTASTQFNSATKSSGYFTSIKMPNFDLGFNSISSSPSNSRSSSPITFREESKSPTKEQNRPRSDSIDSNSSIESVRSRGSSPIMKKITTAFTAKNDVTPKIDSMIDTWLKENPDSTSSMYVQADLEDAISDMIFTTNKTTKARELADPTISIAKIKEALKTLMEKYKTNPDVTTVLKTNLETIDTYQGTQKNIPQQTNTTISPFYTPEVKTTLLTMLHIKPEFDKTTGAITNMPSIEMIREEAIKNPTQQSFNAVNAALKAIQVAKYTIANDSSILNDIHSYNPLIKSNVTTQLTTFETQLKSALENPSFDKYKSVVLKDVLDATGLSNLTISSAVDYLRSGLKNSNYAADKISQIKNDPLLDASGYAASALGGYARLGIPGAIIDTLLYHVAKENIPVMVEKLNKMTIKELLEIITPSEKDVIMSAHETLNDLNSNKITLQGEFNKIVKGSNAEQIAQAQSQANSIVNNYYYRPKLQDAVFALTGGKAEFDQATGAIKNMPSIETILEKANANPSQIAYKAVQSALKATETAIYSAEYDGASLLSDTLYIKQLHVYKDLLTQTMSKPEMIKYEKIINRTNDYVKSITPTTADVINATGVMNTKIDTVLNDPTTTKVINLTLNTTGLGKTTIGQLV